MKFVIVLFILIVFFNMCFKLVFFFLLNNVYYRWNSSGLIGKGGFDNGGILVFFLKCVLWGLFYMYLVKDK